MSMENCHLHLLAPSEHWELDPAANVLRRVIRDHKSLMPYVNVITDDVLGAYNAGNISLYTNVYRYISTYVNIFRRTSLYSTGIPCVDSSIRPGGEDRVFKCRANLLFWTGDYPAQAKTSGTHEKTCHWCCHKSSPSPESNRRAWVDFRRFLPDNHEYRSQSPFFGNRITRPRYIFYPTLTDLIHHYITLYFVLYQDLLKQDRPLLHARTKASWRMPSQTSSIFSDLPQRSLASTRGIYLTKRPGSKSSAPFGSFRSLTLSGTYFQTGCTSPPASGKGMFSRLSVATGTRHDRKNARAGPNRKTRSLSPTTRQSWTI